LIFKYPVTSFLRHSGFRNVALALYDLRSPAIKLNGYFLDRLLSEVAFSGNASNHFNISGISKWTFLSLRRINSQLSSKVRFRYYFK